MAENLALSVKVSTLINIGAVTDEQATDAFERTPKDASGQIMPGESIVVTMLRENMITREDLAQAHATERRCRYAPQEKITPKPEVLEMVPHEVAREHRIVPLGVMNGKLLIACMTPSRQLKNALENLLNYELDYAIASETTLNAKISEFYSAASEASHLDLSSSFDNEAATLDNLIEAADTGDGAESAGIVKMVRLIIAEGITRGASDIHFEPHGKMYRVRYRVDGSLAVAEDLTLTPAQAVRIISRIKVMANLDTAERRKPQDGRVSFRQAKRKIDLRIAVLPSKSDENGGEKVVMRILDGSVSQKPLSQLDFSPRNLSLMETLLQRPHGILLVTGPTGSGKSTTLYSGIKSIATDDRSIYTVEDPVEYKLDGISQTQVETKIGVTFESVLKSFLRADPDVILVGEIRDGITAEIAVKAALTGHLVLSTLHTNSAALTISRLLEMGTEPYLLADALLGALSQRLVKRLCTKCRVPVESNFELVQAMSGEDFPEHLPTIYEANPDGCRLCNRGYKGRIPLHELLPITDAMREAIIAGKPVEEIEKIGVESGMLRTLLQDGWDKIVAGHTDVAQVAAIAQGGDAGLSEAVAGL